MEKFCKKLDRFIFSYLVGARVVAAAAEINKSVPI